MRSWIAMLALLAACGFSSSKTGDTDAAVVGEDSRMPDASTRFGTIISVVLSTYPTEPKVVMTADLDIDTGPTSPMCDPAVVAYCAVAATSFTVAPGRKIRGHGTRPLLLVSLTMFDLSGDIDVSSPVDGPAGAGAFDASACLAVLSPPLQATGASGGFGGTFSGKGGDGDGVNGTRGSASVSTVTWPMQVALPTVLRGGCPGGSGGGGGFGGNGGGAVAIIASSIIINGKINASGAGGKGGPAAQSGGGGGGSGGMIILDVPAASQIARNGAGALFASGGGGGEGGTAGVTPTAGQDGHNAASPDAAAAGGTSGNDGGDGGAGSFKRVLNGASTGGQPGPDGGGGGGGGGAGLIVAPGIMGDTFIAPPSST